MRGTRHAGPPFRLRDFTGGSFEGVPPQNAARRLLAGTESYDATLWVFFGRSDPTEEQLDRAQAELHRLELPSWPDWNAISASGDELPERMPTTGCASAGAGPARSASDPSARS